MALTDNAWYVNFGDGSTTGYYAITKWATGATIAAGALRRQNAAPAVGSERVFVAVVGGTTHATTEPTWVITRGGKTTDNTVTWQECTGIAALNGDLTNTPAWGVIKGTAITLGQVIKRANSASYQICTTAGTAGTPNEPAFSDTAGTTTADNTVTWTSLGAVGNFTGWQAPHARLANALTATWGAAGNAFFVGDNHAETQTAAMNLQGPGTPALPCFVYCVNHSGSLPPASGDLLKTATITSSSTNVLNIFGYAYYYGIQFIDAANSNGAIAVAASNVTGLVLDNCLLSSTSAGSSAGIRFGGTSFQSIVTLINTPLSFGSTTNGGVSIDNIHLIWKNTASALAGSVPSTVFGTNSAIGANVKVIGVDLSAAGSGKTLIGGLSAPIAFMFADCKLGASVTLAAAQVAQGGAKIDFIRCDSGATNYFSARRWYEGSQDQETTIVRTGGATDGTTPLAWKLVTSANSRWTFPFESQPISIWNDSTSAITTLTIYGTTTGGGVPKDDEIWVEVEYLGASGSPMGSFITSTKANNLAASAATNNSSDASTWAGGGAGNGFKIVVPSFTPGQKGPINITIKAAKISSTYYIDPRPSISGVTVSKSFIAASGVYANELSAGGLKYNGAMAGNIG